MSAFWMILPSIATFVIGISYVNVMGNLDQVVKDLMECIL